MSSHDDDGGGSCDSCTKGVFSRRSWTFPKTSPTILLPWPLSVRCFIQTVSVRRYQRKDLSDGFCHTNLFLNGSNRREYHYFRFLFFFLLDDPVYGGLHFENIYFFKCACLFLELYRFTLFFFFTWTRVCSVGLLILAPFPAFFFCSVPGRQGVHLYPSPAGRRQVQRAGDIMGHVVMVNRAW